MIHPIARERLCEEGMSHDLVAARMVEAFDGHDLVASAPSLDGKWLSVLLRAVALARHRLRAWQRSPDAKDCREHHAARAAARALVATVSDIRAEA
ncbi:hypothetical protein [Sphingobium sp. BHU LFT2]|uniref:hypothetical protein n=1 Tax=Sphingobium sp. BHU LFT2 TaxID=2807634 RepID=UPI002035E38D|nr:hypothetical protein [Sphingobium sp. BHU LFT2]